MIWWCQKNVVPLHRRTNQTTNIMETDKRELEIMALVRAVGMYDVRHDLWNWVLPDDVEVAWSYWDDNDTEQNEDDAIRMTLLEVSVSFIERITFQWRNENGKFIFNTFDTLDGDCLDYVYNELMAWAHYTLNESVTAPQHTIPINVTWKDGNGESETISVPSSVEVGGISDYLRDTYSRDVYTWDVGDCDLSSTPDHPVCYMVYEYDKELDDNTVKAVYLSKEKAVEIIDKGFRNAIQGIMDRLKKYGYTTVDAVINDLEKSSTKSKCFCDYDDAAWVDVSDNSRTCGDYFAFFKEVPLID